MANSLGLTVSKLDPATGTVTATVDVGDGPSSIVAAGNCAMGERRVRRHARPHRREVGPGGPHGSPGQLAAGHGGGRFRRMGCRAPVPGGQPPRRHLDRRGRYLPQTDPALADDFIEFELFTVYDGLTAFRRSGDAAGLTLVPDLATTLPRPTAGGTTYTFTLRRGIRYSNGNLVRASDFRRGLQRQLSFGNHPDYYEVIRGGPRASSIRTSAICPPGSSPMTRPAGSPSTWSRRIPTSSTSSHSSTSPPLRPVRPTAPSAARRSCPAPGPT